MELRHLLALEAVLATGSFTAAAAARHVSQPALWGQIKDLEAELGLSLFVRAGRGVAPTAACRALRPRLTVALADVAELRRIAAEIREGWAAPARIGCASSHVAHFLAGCVQALMARDPRTPFPVIVPVTSASAIESLERGRIDLLVEPRSRPRGLGSVVLYPMRVVAAGPSADRARRGALDVRELDGRPLATLPRDSLVRSMLDDAASRTGTALRVVYEDRDAAALLALARAGACTAVIHDEMLAHGETLSAPRLAVGARTLESPLRLTWRSEESLSPAARQLRDVMRERARARSAAGAAERTRRTVR